MNMFQHIAKIATIGAVTVLFAASFAAAEQGGRYWVPTTTVPDATSRALRQRLGTHNAATQKRARPLLPPWPGLHPNP